MRLTLLVSHILGGMLGLLTGTVAMAARKGAHLHRLSGHVFTIGMLTLAVSGFFLAILKAQPGNMIGSVATAYLVATAWLAGRRRDPGLLDWAALLLGFGGAVAMITFAVRSLPDPARAGGSGPLGMSFFLGAVLLLGSVGDLRLLLRKGLARRQRIMRHLWRMCFGLFIATGSFFLGQQQVFPASLHGSFLLTILAVLPLPLLVYWAVRVRFGKAYREGALPDHLIPGRGIPV